MATIRPSRAANRFAPKGPLAPVVGANRQQTQSRPQTVRGRILQRQIDKDAQRVASDRNYDTAEREGIEETIRRLEAKKMSRRWFKRNQASEVRREQRKLKRRAKTDPMAKMQLDQLRIQEAFNKAVVNAGLIDPKKTAAEQEGRMSGLSQSYAQMQVLTTLSPLRRGVSVPTVAQAVGMGTVMYLLSDEYRSVVKGLRPAINKHINKKIEREEEKINRKIAKLEAQGKSREDLPQRWRKRLQAIEMRKRGGRQPFDEKSFALLKMGLAESAYANMRDPRVPRHLRQNHIQNVRDSYEQSMQIVERYMEEDGVNPRDVQGYMGAFIARRADYEPGYEQIYADFSHGRCEPVRNEQNMPTGYFRKPDGEIYPIMENYGPRNPGTRGDHSTICAGVISNQFASAKTTEELDTFLKAYSAASVASRFPGLQDEMPPGTSPKAREIMAKADAMFGAMRADGMSLQEQKMIYTRSIIEGITNSTIGNQLISQWESELEAEGQNKDDWRQIIAKEINDASEYARAEEAKFFISELMNEGYAREEAQKITEEHQQYMDDRFKENLDPRDPRFRGDWVNQSTPSHPNGPGVDGQAYGGYSSPVPPPPPPPAPTGSAYYTDVPPPPPPPPAGQAYHSDTPPPPPSPEGYQSGETQYGDVQGGVEGEIFESTGESVSAENNQEVSPEMGAGEDMPDLDDSTSVVVTGGEVSVVESSPYQQYPDVGSFEDLGLKTPPPGLKGRISESYRLAIMDRMADYVAYDLTESAREGIIMDKDVYREDHESFNNSLGKWMNPGDDHPQPDTPQAQRQTQMQLTIQQHFDALEIPQEQREAMYAMVVARGVDKAAMLNPGVEMKMQRMMIMAGEDGSVGPNAYYYDAMSNNAELFDKWDRQFSEIDKRNRELDEFEAMQGSMEENSVYGSVASYGKEDMERASKIYESGSGAVRTSQLGPNISTAQKHIRARRLMEYNAADTGKILGIGRDDAQIGQDGEPALGEDPRPEMDGPEL